MAQFSRGWGALLLKRFQSTSPTHIPAYKTQIGQGGAQSDILAYQKIFKVEVDSQAIYIRGSNDKTIYRGLMTTCGIGIGLAFYALFQMATGRMKAKPRS